MRHDEPICGRRSEDENDARELLLGRAARLETASRQLLIDYERGTLPYGRRWRPSGSAEAHARHVVEHVSRFHEHLAKGNVWQAFAELFDASEHFDIALAVHGRGALALHQQARSKGQAGGQRRSEQVRQRDQKLRELARGLQAGKDLTVAQTADLVLERYPGLKMSPERLKRIIRPALTPDRVRKPATRH